MARPVELFRQQYQFARRIAKEVIREAEAPSTDSVLVEELADAASPGK